MPSTDFIPGSFSARSRFCCTASPTSAETKRIASVDTAGLFASRRMTSSRNCSERVSTSAIASTPPQLTTAPRSCSSLAGRS